MQDTSYGSFDKLSSTFIKLNATCKSAVLYNSFTQNVFISPFPLTLILPRARIGMSVPESNKADDSEQWMRFFSEFDSIREAVFTVSPKRQYRGFREPTTLATTGPE
mmetsp:Transcript_2848/g.4133  ORF Transcript_2848/g.4133 Transcript_2848/m.4133 type:complete len:107 (+) Transcript_2848:264-584(+)